jgi:hypothetical protein
MACLELLLIRTCRAFVQPKWNGTLWCISGWFIIMHTTRDFLRHKRWRTIYSYKLYIFVICGPLAGRSLWPTFSDGHLEFLSPLAGLTAYTSFMCLHCYNVGTLKRVIQFSNASSKNSLFGNSIKKDLHVWNVYGMCHSTSFSKLVLTFCFSICVPFCSTCRVCLAVILLSAVWDFFLCSGACLVRNLQLQEHWIKLC